MRLDHSSPYVVDTHDLGRRPGTMREYAVTMPAPADLRVELIGVPEGSGVDLDLRLEAVLEGVLVSGVARARLTGECARCLGPVEREVEVPLQELYVYPGHEIADDEAARLDGELLDLEPTLRDAVVLTLPFRPVCRPDCPGLCAQCGIRLADDPGHRHGDDIDPRWAGLAALETMEPAVVSTAETEEE